MMAASVITSTHCGGCGPLPKRPACGRCFLATARCWPTRRGVLDFYLAHRAERLDEVRGALAAGDHNPAEIVARVYAAVDKALWPFAESSVRAQLRYLRDLGEVPPGVTW